MAQPADMIMQPTASSLAPRDILRILFRHKRKSCFVFAATLTLVVAGLVVCPRTYISEAKLFVRIGRESVGLDPTATVGATVSIQDSRESEIRSVIDVLESRLLRQKVVERIGAGPILAQSLDVGTPTSNGLDVRGMLKRGLAWLLPADEVSDEEKAIRLLEKSIEVGAAKKSNVVTILCKSGSPQLSHRIVEVLVDVYRTEHVAVNATESFEFFKEQTEALRQELSQATQELGQMKSDLGLTTITGQRELLESQINNLNRDLSEVTAALSAAESKIAALREENPGLDPRDTRSGTGLTQTAIDTMRDTLYELQIRERELQSKYQDSHPALRAIREQVREVEDILSRQELRIEMANAASLRARRDAIQKGLVEAQQKLRLVNQNEVTISQLERRVELLRANFQTYSEKMEQARVAQALDNEQISNLKVVQPATFVAKAVSPKVPLVLALGVVLAAFSGLGTALIFEFIDHSFQTPEQIESQLNVPVLLAIPLIERPRAAAG